MTDLSKVDSSVKVKDDGRNQVVINGPEKLEIEESMPTTTTEAVTGRTRRRCLPCRCTRFTAAVLGLAVLSLILAALLIVSVVRLRQRSSCSADTDSETSSLTDGPDRVLSNVADDGSPLPWTDIRLPRTVIPESYVLRLRLDPNRDWFHGAADIDVEVKHDTHMIVLHASSLDVGDVNNIHISHKVIQIKSMQLYLVLILLQKFQVNLSISFEEDNTYQTNVFLFSASASA